MNHDSQERTRRTKRANRTTFGKWLYFIVAIVFVGFIVRFAYIGIFKDVHHVNLQSRTAKLYNEVKVIPAKRGTIYDAHHDPIAEDSNRYTVYAVLDHSQKSASGKAEYVKNKTKTAQVLAKNLGMNEADVLKMLNKKGAFQVEFGTQGTNISAAKMQSIKKANLPGIHFLTSPSRQYPQGQFATQLIGVANPVNVNKTGTRKRLVGALGLEQYFNKKLTGKDGYRKGQKDVYGYQVSNSRQKNKAAKNGDDIYTTLNPHTQQLLESQMSSVESTTKADELVGVVMDAKTGKIVAASQRPTMHSKTPNWRNILVQDVFEPGSTMKTITLASAIDSGHFDPNATFTSGTWSLGGGKITDWESGGWGTISYKDAIDMSSNVGFAHVEQNMGAATWKKYLNRFHMFQKVNVVGMGNETAGYSAFKGTLQQANTAYGQGITVNVMQLMQAFSAIANNGKMMKPYVVSKVVDSSGHTVKRIKPTVVGHPIKASSAKKTRKLLEGVIYDQKGLGHMYQINGYRVAGKTGTAQIGTSHGYATGGTNYVYSFVGMAPAKNPRYVIYIMMRHPHKVNSSAEDEMATIFKPVMTSVLDQSKAGASHQSSGIVKVPNLVGKNAATSAKQMTAKRLAVTTIGSGQKVIAQSVRANHTAVVNGRLILDTGGTRKMPDISGWSASDVSTLAQMLGLKVKASGNGYVKTSSIKKDAVVHRGQSLKVKYSVPKN